MAIRYWLLYTGFWLLFWVLMVMGAPDKAF